MGLSFTEIINTARITVRQGIVSRRVQSLELFRIQDVRSTRSQQVRAVAIR